MNNRELDATIAKMEKLQARVASADSADSMEFAKTMLQTAVIALLEIAKQNAISNMLIEEDE